MNILPEFGHRSLASLTPQEIAAWEMGLTNEGGYARRTARDARSTLATILNDAVPRYIQSNPAERKRGKGRKGLRRIAKRETAEKVWATPLQALLIAERCAALSGQDTDFVMNIYVAYTGSRWSEVIGLLPECIGVVSQPKPWVRGRRRVGRERLGYEIRRGPGGYLQLRRKMMVEQGYCRGLNSFPHVTVIP